MPKLKITLRKEIEIDLNTYYPNFPRSLRQLIDDQIYQLLGGGSTIKKQSFTRGPVKNHSSKVEVWEFTGREPRLGSQALVVLNELKRQFGEEGFSGNDGREFAGKVGKERGYASRGGQLIDNLMRCGAIKELK